MKYRYYTLNALGEPVGTNDAMVWARWFETANRHLAHDQLSGDVRVSTVFLGLDHSFSQTRLPLLWETLVFGGPLDGEMYRYESRLQAMQGHQTMVEKVREAARARQIDLET